MTTRVYSANTFNEALAKIKNDLGEDAVILKSEKKSTSGGLGLKARQLVEVTAALSSEVKEDVESGTEFAKTLDMSTQDASKGARGGAQTYELAMLRAEVASLRDSMGQILKFFKYNNLPSLPETLSKALDSMTNSGMERVTATELATEAMVQLGPNELESPESVSQYVVRELGKIAPPAANPILRRGSGPQIIALVGSPGAGKTSTLQKLATNPMGYGKRKIGLLTLDTHRLAAIEQLRTFARVSGLALEVAYQTKDVHSALAKLTGCEVILVDTPGCAPGEDDRFGTLLEQLQAANPTETHLVANAAVRTEELQAVFRRFQGIGITHLSFTRLDEAQMRGGIVTLSQKAQKPIAWICDGQSFTKNLTRYRPELLGKWILQTQLEQTADL
jgi:flagellar biosynthesis protein FlhF